MPVTEETWPPSSAQHVLDVIVGIAAHVPAFQATGRGDVLGNLRAVCVDIAERQHAAVAATKAFLLGCLRRLRGGDPADARAQIEALSRLADYLRPVVESHAFRTLRTLAATASTNSAEASPLWSHHDIMRVRPHHAK